VKKVLGLFLTGFLGLSVNAQAGILQITATSSSAGELGWFAVDEDVLAVDTSLQASQFFDFSFANPLGSLTFDPTNVLTDTGWTNFDFIGGEWTVTGGSGDSLTSSDGAVWIALNTSVRFIGEDNFTDVSWATTDFVSVPEPAALLLLGAGLAGLGFTRKFKNA
jgi:hypothetical protein